MGKSQKKLHTAEAKKCSKGGRPPGKHADQYVFQCPGEWERWFVTLLKNGGPTHAILGLLRKNYGARIDGFRLLQREDIQSERKAKDSKISLQPQKGWTKSKWEAMPEEVHSALLLAEKGISVTRKTQETPTGGTVTKTFTFMLPPAKEPMTYIFRASKSGR